METKSDASNSSTDSLSSMTDKFFKKAFASKKIVKEDVSGLPPIKTSEEPDLTKEHINRETIEKMTGFSVNKVPLYQRAFVHVSIQTLVNKTDINTVIPYLRESNEKLEFLGDSILGAITSEFLFRKFPDKDEGFLTKVKTRIINGERLAYFAENLGMKGHLLLSQQAINVGGLTNYRLMEDAFESFIGAIYLDKGYEMARSFVLSVFDRFLEIDEILKDTNYKDYLIRYCNNIKIPAPKFVVRNTEGPPHSRIFIIDVYLYDDILYGTGTERSKKRSEQEASLEALKKLKLI